MLGVQDWALSVSHPITFSLKNIPLQDLPSNNSLLFKPIPTQHLILAHSQSDSSWKPEKGQHSTVKPSLGSEFF